MGTSTCLSRRNCAAKKTPRVRTKNCRGVMPSARLLTQTRLHGQQFQPKTYIELPAVMRAATGQTSDCSFDFAYARESAPAIRATVDETSRITLRRKRQRMTALLVCDSQITASLLPLGSVR